MPDIEYTETDTHGNTTKYRETWNRVYRLHCPSCGVQRVWRWGVWRWGSSNYYLCLRCGRMSFLDLFPMNDQTSRRDLQRLAALREVERHSLYNRESDIPTDTPTAPDHEPAEPVSISQLHRMTLCTNREVANLQDSVIALNRAIASLETRYSQLRCEIPAPTTTPAQPQPADYLPVLTNRQYRALLDLLMCSDPWPIKGEQDDWQHATLIELADHDALMRGYDNWIVAYHEHYYRNDTTSTPNTDTPNTPSTPPNTAPEPARTFSEPLIVKWVNDLIEQARATLRKAIANGLMEMADKAEKLGHDSQCVTALRTAEVRVRHRYWEP